MPIPFDAGLATILAQATVVAPFFGLQFWVALFVGLVLALAFELLLTNVSLALGLSSISGWNESDSNASRSRDKGSWLPSMPTRESVHNVGEKARSATNMVGVWALATSSIAVFFGAFLGVKLSATANGLFGVSLGLAIWGLFYLIMAAFEFTCAGSLVRMATGSLRSAGEGVRSFFSSARQNKKLEHSAADIAAAVRDEVLGDNRVDSLRKTLRRYLQTLRAEHAGDGDEGDEGRGTFARVASGAKKAAKTASQMIEEAREKGPDAVVDAALRGAGYSEDEARGRREKFEQYLRNANREEVDPDAIKGDLEELFEKPGEGWSDLRERLSAIDEDTLVSLLTQREDIDEQTARSIAHGIHQALQRVDEAAMTVVSRARQAAHAVSDTVRHPGEKLHAYLDRVDDPRLDYDDIREDLMTLFEDPRAGAESLLERLRSLDRQTLVELVAATHSSLSEGDAEQMVSAIEKARDEAIAKVEKLKEEVQRRVHQAEAAAEQAAEETRKTAASAAWWAAGAAVASATAAAFGGVIATLTWIT